MTKDDVTCGGRRALRKYQLITGLSVIAALLSAYALTWAYHSHVELLNQGDQVGIQMHRLAITEAKEVRHESR